MKRKLKFVFLAIGGIAVMALIVAVIMGLWNCMVPDITGWSAINYWQALGLTVLFRFLTGTMFPPMFPRKGRRHFHERMHNMPVSERKAFIRRQLNRLTSEELKDEQ